MFHTWIDFSGITLKPGDVISADTPEDAVLANRET